MIEVHSSGSMVELVIQVQRGIDQRQMGEGLREVPLLLAGQADLLREQAQVVGIGRHLLESETRLFEPTRTSERIHIPVGSDRERTLMAEQTIWRSAWIVAVDQAV